MISDKSRGWSWTRALLGLPAHSIHVCGDSAATDLLSQLAQHCNDPLTVNRYRRLSPLIVEPRALDGVQAVLEGDCVVAFGRKALHKLRKNILATNLKGTPRDSSDSGFDSSSESDRSGRRQGVGMVYGALPPEARRTQAALFNAGEPGSLSSVQSMLLHVHMLSKVLCDRGSCQMSHATLLECLAAHVWHARCCWQVPATTG